MPEPPRTRRTSDLLRLLLTLAVMGLVVFAGSVGSGTTEGIQQDITTAVTNVPSLVVSLLATLNNLIVLALPIYVVADLVIRRRWRLLVTALARVVAGARRRQPVLAVRRRSDRRRAARMR